MVGNRSDIAPCTKCGKPFSTYGPNDGVCGTCNVKTKLKKPKSESEKLPMIVKCKRCGKDKIWPLEFPNKTTFLCSHCIKKGDLPVSDLHTKKVREWEAKNPDMVAKQRKRRMERIKKWRLDHPEEAKKRYRDAANKSYLKKKLLKAIEQREKEEKAMNRKKGG